jgi:hypothetical protein
VQLGQRQLFHCSIVWPIGRLASVVLSVSPNLVPVVLWRSTAQFIRQSTAKPKRDGVLQRMRNVAADASVSLLLDQYDDDWTAMVGYASTLPQQSSQSPMGRRLQRIVAALRGKYPQYASVDVFKGAPTLLHLRPTRHAPGRRGRSLGSRSDGSRSDVLLPRLKGAQRN